MLISRKVTRDNRVVTNFRHFNVRITKNNLAYPLFKDAFSVLDSSRCEVLSVLDLKDPFHSLRLSENSKRCCGILPHFGSVLYLYQRMPMGLHISPSMWQSYINAILDCLQSRKYCKAIMDDLLLFTPTKKSHIAKLEDLLKLLLKNGLKISPKKCQLFGKELQYMGNAIFIKDRRVCVKPLWSRLEAIQKLKPPMTVKGCRSFVLTQCKGAIGCCLQYILILCSCYGQLRFSLYSEAVITRTQFKLYMLTFISDSFLALWLVLCLMPCS